MVSPEATTLSVRKYYSLTEDVLNLYRTSPCLNVFLTVAPRYSR